MSGPKRHRWCLTVCLDCGLHRTHAKSGSDKYFMEYRKDIVLHGIKGVALFTGKAGACGALMPPDKYRFFPKELAARADTL